MNVRKSILLTVIVLVSISITLGAGSSPARAAAVKSPQTEVKMISKMTSIQQTSLHALPKSLSITKKGFKVVIQEKGFKVVIHSNTVVPKAVIDCLSVGISVSNPTAGLNVIYLSIFQFCGHAIPNLFWEFYSAINCGDNISSGPADAGNLYLRAGVGYSITERWVVRCVILGIAGWGYSILYDAYSDGYIENNGNVGQGSDQNSYYFI